MFVYQRVTTCFLQFWEVGHGGSIVQRASSVFGKSLLLELNCQRLGSDSPTHHFFVVMSPKLLSRPQVTWIHIATAKERVGKLCKNSSLCK